MEALQYIAMCVGVIAGLFILASFVIKDWYPINLYLVYWLRLLCLYEWELAQYLSFESQSAFLLINHIYIAIPNLRVNLKWFCYFVINHGMNIFWISDFIFIKCNCDLCRNIKGCSIGTKKNCLRNNRYSFRPRRWLCEWSRWCWRWNQIWNR